VRVPLLLAHGQRRGRRAGRGASLRKCGIDINDGGRSSGHPRDCPMSLDPCRAEKSFKKWNDSSPELPMEVEPSTKPPPTLWR
jgi:hypothetical protein